MSPTFLKSDFQYTFTVFTPTYNRANTLHRVYESLAKQSFRDFEWLIVDDGSSDNTKALVQEWQEHAVFPIRYLFQPNRGKHMAMNRGAVEARGRLFLTIDSDDACLPTALERFAYYWESIPFAQRDRFSAVTALCVYSTGELVGNRFPRDILDSNSIEIGHRYKSTGDKWGFQRTDVMRRFPFPSVEGESYVTEAIVWRAIARHFQTRFVNEPLLVVYRSHGEGDAPSLSATRVHLQAEGRRRYCSSILNQDIRWLKTDPSFFAKTAANFTRCSLHRNIAYRQQWREIGGLVAKMLWLVFLPVGRFLYWRDMRGKVQGV